MPTNEFLKFATGGGANVVSQAAYLGAAWRTGGFVNGIAEADQVSKVFRQSGFWAAVLGQFVVNRLGVDALDDGDDAAMLGKLINAIAGGSMPTTTTNVNFLASDARKTYLVGAPITMTFPATSTLFNGWYVYVSSFGGTATLIPNGTDTFRCGRKSFAVAGSLVVPLGASALITTDGAGIINVVMTQVIADPTIITAPGGPNNYTVPDGCFRLRIRGWGTGGGGGGGQATAGGVVKPAGGGGGGGYGEFWLGYPDVFPGAVIAYTIGTGGVAGTAGGDGNAGSNTVIGAAGKYLTLTTGGGGANGANGSGGAPGVPVPGASAGQMVAPFTVPGQRGAQGNPVGTSSGIGGTGGGCCGIFGGAGTTAGGNGATGPGSGGAGGTNAGDGGAGGNGQIIFEPATI